ncbi:hypothetical protein SDC9_142630 [bioreactor metagenome]|uniref:Uncharacterized protein n=1 Tax=bioreactor metagenome TaxID=1076179 RepID=A0A645E1P0_9ZZZZ
MIVNPQIGIPDIKARSRLGLCRIQERMLYTGIQNEKCAGHVIVSGKHQNIRKNILQRFLYAFRILSELVEGQAVCRKVLIYITFDQF